MPDDETKADDEKTVDPQAEQPEDIEDDPSHNPPEELDDLRGA
jgi:hypothetical protein